MQGGEEADLQQDARFFLLGQSRVKSWILRSPNIGAKATVEARVTARGSVELLDLD